MTVPISSKNLSLSGFNVLSLMSPPIFYVNYQLSTAFHSSLIKSFTGCMCSIASRTARAISPDRSKKDWLSIALTFTVTCGSTTTVLWRSTARASPCCPRETPGRPARMFSVLATSSASAGGSRNGASGVGSALPPRKSPAIFNPSDAKPNPLFKTPPNTPLPLLTPPASPASNSGNLPSSRLNPLTACVFVAVTSARSPINRAVTSSALPKPALSGPRVSVSPRRSVSASPRPRVSVSPPVSVSASRPDVSAASRPAAWLSLAARSCSVRTASARTVSRCASARFSRSLVAIRIQLQFLQLRPQHHKCIRAPRWPSQYLRAMPQRLVRIKVLQPGHALTRDVAHRAFACRDGIPPSHLALPQPDHRPLGIHP